MELQPLRPFLKTLWPFDMRPQLSLQNPTILNLVIIFRFVFCQLFNSFIMLMEFAHFFFYQLSKSNNTCLITLLPCFTLIAPLKITQFNANFVKSVSVLFEVFGNIFAFCRARFLTVLGLYLEIRPDYA